MLEKLESNNSKLITDSGSENTIRVVLNDQKEGMIFCPKCKNFVIKDLSNMTNAKTAARFKCKCKCGYVFSGMVERRQSFRKSVDLEGMCLYIDGYSRTNKQAIKIHDISMTGLQISVDTLPEFMVGDDLIVIFKLDDREQTEIQENSTVIRIKTNTAGLKFKSSRLIGKLGLYLMG